MKKYYYQIYPVNYTLLYEDEQISIIEGFKELLNQIRRDYDIEDMMRDRVFDLFRFMTKFRRSSLNVIVKLIP